MLDQITIVRHGFELLRLKQLDWWIDWSRYFTLVIYLADNRLENPFPCDTQLKMHLKQAAV